MKLTEKDKEFLEKLRALQDKRDLLIESREDGIKRLILRKNYGDKIEGEFGMTRQGVRWRFQRLLNEIYPSAYETILFIETSFGVELRAPAMAIARQRAEMRREALERTGQRMGPGSGGRNRQRED
ncbi:MAG: hypothetical protein NTW86_14310 [Candidatus Sumerlaeota bacterium]|nr:hypothetical protein [Candidatus Sumerlaeota bacterium]